MRKDLHGAPTRWKVVPVETSLRDVSARHARVRLLEATEKSSAPDDAEPDSGQSRAKTPLLLLHDVFAAHDAFTEMLPHLVQMYKVLAPDLPGFGESEKPSPSRYGYEAPRFAESMLDVLAAVGEARAVVCGHGLGAAIALALAADHPGIVSRLVLIDPPFYQARAARFARWLRVPIVGPFVVKQAVGRTMFRAHFRDDVYGAQFPFASSPAAARVESWFDRFDAPAAREAAFATLRGLADTRAVVARIPRVHIPTLILWGRDDKLAPSTAGRRLAREINGARFEVFECGHSPVEEVPEDVARAITRFGAPAEVQRRKRADRPSAANKYRPTNGRG